MRLCSRNSMRDPRSTVEQTPVSAALASMLLRQHEERFPIAATRNAHPRANRGTQSRFCGLVVDLELRPRIYRAHEALGNSEKQN